MRAVYQGSVSSWRTCSGVNFSCPQPGFLTEGVESKSPEESSWVENVWVARIRLTWVLFGATGLATSRDTVFSPTAKHTSAWLRHSFDAEGLAALLVSSAVGLRVAIVGKPGGIVPRRDSWPTSKSISCVP